MASIPAGHTFRMAAVMLFVIAAVCIITLAVGSSEDSSASQSGQCGTNATWSLDDEGVLTISGTGPTDDWSAATAVPWFLCGEGIKTVTVEDGITAVGGYAFSGCTEVTEITIAPSVTTLGEKCFTGCGKLTTITMTGVTNISGAMFSGCNGLKTINFNEDLYKHGEYDFCVYTADMKNLIYFPAGRHYERFEIDSNVERVCTCAFEGSCIAELVIPKTIKYFDDRAFADMGVDLCHAFELSPDVVSVGKDIFGNNRSCVYFHLDFKGDAGGLLDYGYKDKDGNVITDKPAGLLGYQFGNNVDHDYYTVDFAALSIKYLYPDGSQAADRYYELCGAGLQYEIGSPGIAGYDASIQNVSGTTDLSVVDVTVIYSNTQYKVVYYVNGNAVINDQAYYGYTVDVKEYDTGTKVIKDWFSLQVTPEDGKFVMPDQDVYFSDIPLKDIMKAKTENDVSDSVLIGSAIGVMILAGLMLALFVFRRH